MDQGLTLFILKACPYCKQVLRWMEELKQENAAYGDIPLRIVDERKEPEVAARHNYYYVPTYYLDGNKVHEGVANREIVRKVFEMALERG
ncbi:thioredoxin family protein [Anaerotalea alkaliphila]|uniref:Thioredoxin family protein n=1 Tax=Anaerotalea alkaliphila TaxID=2662126 RepID=A0A7X5KNF7_9FIRM|nr:thioredoxin family protein [Anaerotalea alkaliphila]NDL68824.1 thioredoxin family protein [Anaerotalea alkaliphila]